MNEAAQNGVGMDIVIVSTGNQQQADFWQQRLDQMRGYVTKADAIVTTVDEDWPGGAGNGLGTLYAYQKGRKKILERLGIDITDKQKAGASIAIYHTAGQGTRLSPLTESESGNKPAVRLPGHVGPPHSHELITILEAVIKQTALYAPFRKGRLSVFWGDQVFIPSRRCAEARGHAEILVKDIENPTQEQWNQQELSRYGLIATNEQMQPCYLEKISYETFSKLSSSAKANCGISMGSFSLSAPLTFALLKLFENELQQRNSKMDVEPFIWMPATLDLETYAELMQQRGYSFEMAKSHYARIQKFGMEFSRENSRLPFFSTADIGSNSLWWDFGTVKSYAGNLLKLTGSDDESQLIRLFFNCTLSKDGSCLLNCHVRSGSMKNCVLADVTATHLDISDCVIIKSRLNRVTGSQCTFYNVREQDNLNLAANTVRADFDGAK